MQTKECQMQTKECESLSAEEASASTRDILSEPDCGEESSDDSCTSSKDVQEPSPAEEPSNADVGEPPIAVGSLTESAGNAESEDTVFVEEQADEPPVFPLDEESEESYYARRAEEDMCELSALFPALSPSGTTLTLGDLRNPTRFAELREAGLSVEEAFLASNYRMLTEKAKIAELSRENCAPARSALPRSQGRGTAMPASLLLRSRALFEGMSDSELASLYRRVTE